MRQLTPEELTKPFFARDSTKDYIEAVAAAEDLTVYLGAGASVDRTGRTWRQLMVDLLVKSCDLNEESIQAIAKVLDPMSLASIVAEFARESSSQPETLAGNVRDLLYQQGGDLKGQALVALSDVALELSLRGKAVRLLTTNYDEYLTKDFTSQVEFWRTSYEAKRRFEEVQALDGLAGSPPITYLHGLVPERGEIVEAPVLSELQYKDSLKKTHSALTAALTSQTTVMVGASVTDPPLVRALLNTKGEAATKHRMRFALLPRSDVGAMADDERSLQVLSLWQQRLAHLGVQGIFVDSFSQVGQFLREVHTALAFNIDDYARSRMTHGARLDRWWSAWSDDLAAAFDDRQEMAHHMLRGLLVEVCEELEATNERIKIEIWPRWHPGSARQDRALRLWASSYSRFTDYELTRSASLAEPGQSDYVAVRAFKEGRPIHVADTDANRWRSYLAAPVYLSEEVNLAVGSIVIASMARPEHSQLAHRKKALHAKALNVAQRRAQTILTPPTGASVIS